MYWLGILVTPLLKALVALRTLKGLETPLSRRNRFGKPTAPSFDGPPLWVHAASVGEVISALPLIRKLKAHNPSQPLLLTTTTCTAAQVVASRLAADICVHQFIPFDCPHLLARFWRHWQPAKLILVESEVWPNLLAVAQRLGTPVYLVNARFSPRSQRRWLQWGWLARRVFTKISQATAPNDQTADFLREVGVQRVTCLPHLKYAAEPLPYDSAKHAFYTQAIKGRPTWVAASIHPGEDACVIKAHRMIQNACPTALTFLVPRHPSRCAEIEKKLKEAGIVWVRHTQAHNLDGVEMVLVDTLGELGLFYALSGISFVGGSLAPHIGGHNPIEPALYAHALTWGPYVHNFTDICHDLQPAAQVATGPEALADIITQWLQNPEQAQERGQAALRIAQHKRSGLDELVSVITA